MSMDRDFQTKDQAYDWINNRLILMIGVVGLGILAFWLLLTVL